MRFLSVLSLIALFPLVGCSPDPKPLIIKELASQGYDNVQFSSMGASAGAFAFTADKGNQACRGTAAVIGSGSDPLVDLTLDCPKPKAQEAPRVVEDPYKKLSEECEAGDAKRCFELGDKLVNGNVTARDLPRARKVHQGACDKEHMGACVQLGGLFLKGLGGAQDVDRAEEIFQATCDGGYMDGCARLARVSFVAGDYKTARKVFEKACDGGSHL